MEKEENLTTSNQSQTTITTPSYQNLFGSDAYYTVPNHRSVLSPAAYLVDLIKLVENNITVGSRGIPLTERRKDLLGITLSKENTDDEISKLSIVNELLEGIPNVGSDQLATAHYPFDLPYDAYREKIRACLKYHNTSLQEIWENMPEAAEGSINQEILGLSNQQWTQFTKVHDASGLSKYYGKSSSISSSTTQIAVTTFLELTGLSQAELKELIYQDLSEEEIESNIAANFFINNGGATALADIVPIAISNENLINLSYTKLDRIMRFVRLAQTIGWSFTNLDWALQTIGTIVNTANAKKPIINDDALPYLAWIQTQIKNNGLTVNQCCGALGQLKTTGKANGLSFYEQVFKNPNNPQLPASAGTDNAENWHIVEADNAKPGLHKKIENALAAALQISSTDLMRIADLIMKYETYGAQKFQLSMANLALLYRMSLIPKLTGFTMQEAFIAAEIIQPSVDLMTALRNAGTKFDALIGKYFVIRDPNPTDSHGFQLKIKSIAASASSLHKTYTIKANMEGSESTVILKVNLSDGSFYSLTVSGNAVPSLTAANAKKMLYLADSLNNELVNAADDYSKLLSAVSQIEELFTWLSDAPISLGELQFIVQGSSADLKVQNSIVNHNTVSNFINNLKGSISKVEFNESTLYQSIYQDLMQLVSFMVNEMNETNPNSKYNDILKHPHATAQSIVDFAYNTLEEQDVVQENILLTASLEDGETTAVDIIAGGIVNFFENTLAGLDPSGAGDFSNEDVQKLFKPVADNLVTTIQKYYDIQQKTFAKQVGALYHVKASIGAVLIQWGDLNIEDLLQSGSQSQGTSGQDIIIPNLLASILPLGASKNQPDSDSIDKVVTLMQKLQQVAMLITTLSLSSSEATYFKTRFSVNNSFPIDLSSIEKIWKFKQLTSIFKDSQNILLNILQSSSSDDPLSALMKLTGWKEADIKAIKPNWSNQDSTSISKIWFLQYCFCTAALLNISTAETISFWMFSQDTARNTLDSQMLELSNSLWAGLKAQLKDQPTALTKIENHLNEKLRDKLVSYALYQCSKESPNPLSNYSSGSRGLYEYLLIDVEVSGVPQTTKVREAISAVQLYINRCLNQLEPDTNIDAGSQLSSLWTWMQSYREWQANMEVFLYPEDYIQPELRVDKTDLFSKAEHAINSANLQDEDSVKSIFRSYVNDFKEIGKIQTLSFAARQYEKEEGDVEENMIELCMLGTSGAGKYYYRLSTFRKSNLKGEYVPFQWGQWKKMSSQLQPVEYSSGEYASPSCIYAMGNWYVFWVEQQQVGSVKNSDAGSAGQPNNFKEYNANIYLSHLDFNENWSAKELVASVPLFDATASTPSFKSITSASDASLTLSYSFNTIQCQFQNNIYCYTNGEGKVEFIRHFDTSGGSRFIFAGGGQELYFCSIGQNWVPFTNNYATGLPSKLFYYDIKMHNETFYLCTDQGLFQCLNDWNWNWTQVRLNDSNNLPIEAEIIDLKQFVMTSTTYLIAWGPLNTYVSTDNGSNWYSLQNADHINTDGLPKDMIYNIFGTINELLYLGCNQGLFSFNPSATGSNLKWIPVVHGTGSNDITGNITGIYDAPGSSNNIICFVWGENEAYCSNDGGTQWNTLANASPYNASGLPSGIKYKGFLIGYEHTHLISNKGLYSFNGSSWVQPKTVSGDLISVPLEQFVHFYRMTDTSDYTAATFGGDKIFLSKNYNTTTDNNIWHKLANATPLNDNGLPTNLRYDYMTSVKINTHDKVFLGTNKGIYKFHHDATSWELQSFLAFWVDDWSIITQNGAQYLSIPTNSSDEYQLYRLTSSALSSLGEYLNGSTGIDNLLSIKAQLTAEKAFTSPSSDKEYSPSDNYSSSNYFPHLPSKQIDFTSNNSLRMYFWELFFHLPFLIAREYKTQQHFAQAKKWYEYIFNPAKKVFNQADDEDQYANDMYWNFQGLRIGIKDNSGNYINDRLRKELQEGEQKELEIDLMNPVQLYASDSEPFDPQAIAQLRPISYQKTIVSHYVNNLIAWGDVLYQQNTRDSINEAEMLYVSAYNLLGQQPQDLGEVPLPQTATVEDTINATSINGVTCLATYLIGSKYGLSRKNASGDWEKVDHPVLGTAEITAVYSELSPNVAYLAGTKENGLFYSADAKTWTACTSSNAQFVTSHVLFIARHKEKYFAGTSQGIYIGTLTGDWGQSSRLGDGVEVNCFYQESQIDLFWVGTNNNSVLYYNPNKSPYWFPYWAKTENPIKDVTAIYQRPDEELYVGTTNGLFWGKTNPLKNNALSGKHITCIHYLSAPKKIMYAGTKENGLYAMVDGDSDWTQVEGIPNNICINYMLINPYIAVGTSNGFFVPSSSFTHMRLYPYALEDTNLSYFSVSSLYFSGPNGIWEQPIVEHPSDTEFYPVHLFVQCFGIPRNQQFLNYWDELKSRLYNIRHGLTINGQTDNLALFSPPINPMQLVEAIGSGESVEEAVQLSNSVVPYYRFETMIEKAKSATATVVALGEDLLLALQSQDAQKLSELNNTYQQNILNLSKTSQQEQIKIIAKQQAALSDSLSTANTKLTHYTNLINNGLNSYEQYQLTLSGMARDFDIASTPLQLAAIIGYGIPTIFGFADGGSSIGGALNESASLLQEAATVADKYASIAGVRGGYQRRAADWQLSQTLAQDDVDQLNSQISIASIQMNQAQNDLASLEKNIEQTQKVAQFFLSKYTTDQLYSWYIGQVSSLFYQSYELAKELAMQAENAWNYENIGRQKDNVSFITSGNWNSLYQGLLAGESLQLDLQRMEKAYMDQNQRRLEIQKSVSLALLDPVSLVNLINHGSCQFDLTERDFAFDYPGHYCRQIKSVSVSIVTSENLQSINATLTQLSNKVIMTDDADGIQAATYLLKKEGHGGTSLLSDLIPNQQVALSKTQSDTGLFELDFGDPRYLPFEGTGAISSWQLDLPKNENFINYESITDVIVEIKYTALQANQSYKQAIVGTDATPGLRGAFSGYQALSLAEEFSNAWKAFIATPGNGLSFSFKADEWRGVSNTVTIDAVYLVADGASMSGVELSITDNSTGVDDGKSIDFNTWTDKDCLASGNDNDFSLPVGSQNSKLSISSGTLPTGLNNIIILVKYSASS